MTNNRCGFGVLLLGLVAFGLQGCAHARPGPADRDLDQKLARETAVKTRHDLRVETATLIQKSPGLKDDQRADLEALRAKTAAKLDKLRAESLKLRALLVRELVESSSDPAEVTIIKKRIADLMHERLSVFLGAVREANLVLGRWASRDARTSGEFLDEMTVDMFEWY